MNLKKVLKYSDLPRSKNLPGYQTKFQIVCDLLRFEILKGKYKPGQRLPIEEVTKRFGVSPIPVREAFKRLDAEGLIKIIPHIGARVVETSYQDIESDFQILSVLVGLATKLAHKRLQKSDFVKLENLMSEMDKSLQRRNLSLFEELDRKFHDYIYSLSNDKRLIELISSILEAVYRYRSYIGRSQIAKVSNTYHRNIVSNLRRGRLNEAENYARDHVLIYGKNLLRAIKSKESKRK